MKKKRIQDLLIEELEEEYKEMLRELHRERLRDAYSELRKKISFYNLKRVCRRLL